MSAAEQPSHDVLIIGGGIMGLWCAVYALGAGLTVHIVDKSTIGSGASGGILGALMPHQPVGWSDKKALQYEGLTRLPTEITWLEGETGLQCDYRRCGRVMPIRKPGQKIQSERWASGSLDHWKTQNGMTAQWNVLDAIPSPERWFGHENAPLGANHDTLSAAIDPRKLINALWHFVTMRGATITENCPVGGIDEEGIATCEDGRTLHAQKIVVAAGFESFPMMAPILNEMIGCGVKGQAAILQPESAANPDWPIIYDSGLYLIARPDGQVALGSTSEENWQTTTGTDEKLDQLIVRACSLSPILTTAKVTERWSAIRPKTFSREPLAGPLAGSQRIFALTGGFKISLGIAHILANALVKDHLA